MSITLLFFFFYVPAPTEIYTLSLHDAFRSRLHREPDAVDVVRRARHPDAPVRLEQAATLLQPLFVELVYRLERDRKSTRLNSSHANISYAVFCLKKKKLQQ